MNKKKITHWIVLHFILLASQSKVSIAVDADTTKSFHKGDGKQHFELKFI